MVRWMSYKLASIIFAQKNRRTSIECDFIEFYRVRV